ncbi:hypothetical protein SDC9_201136 [bioreactor metagenome]|uniref:Uncharacterized protein n=1 Tax=bioreactor metagenome TaxID=1076179 RepID=A0A645IRM6_9ZZZZ
MRVRIPRGISERVIFLDRNLNVKIEIPPGIGDAKAALSEHAADEIRARKDAPALQLVRRVARRCVVISADGTLSVFCSELRHAAHAGQIRVNHRLILSRLR